MLLLATLALSVAFSPWWNPWEYSLSSLGSVSNGLGGAFFDGGLATTAWSLTQVKDRFQTILLTIALFAALVAAINIDFGVLHFLVSVLVFLAMFAYVLAHGDALAYAGSAVSAAVWASHFALGLPPGAAIPELVTISLTMYYLLK